MTLTLTTTHPKALASTADRWLDRELYPFAPRRFATPAGSLSYLDEGQGPPILFVHGTPSWSFEWRDVVRALSASHRCVAPDHLGFGLSDKPADAPLTPADHAARLAALVDALDLTDLTLVVHDFGGPIGLPLALTRPERVRRLVILNSFLWPTAGDPALQRIDRVIRGPLGRFLYRWLNLSPRVLLPASFGQRSRLTPRIHRQYLGPFRRRADRQAPYAMARALVGESASYGAHWEQRDTLARLPVTLVWGERDPAFTEVHLQRWLQAFPDAALIRVPDAGHFVAEERPDAVIDALRGALQRG